MTSVDEAAETVSKAMALDRRHCRAAFEARFTAQLMAEDYLAIYQKGGHVDESLSDERRPPGSRHPYVR